MGVACSMARRFPPPTRCSTTTVLSAEKGRKQEVGGSGFCDMLWACPDCTVTAGWNRHSAGPPEALIYGEALGPAFPSNKGPDIKCACLIRYRGMVSIIARLALCFPCRSLVRVPRRGLHFLPEASNRPSGAPKTKETLLRWNWHDWLAPPKDFFSLSFLRF
ncbi:hypothetical protein BDP81DRAFT_50282 [Colletotrichum phormii]|uniref:Uncharacterized protein n=1 Tax=Colletotrichum phormii TaxID=359342 RepID=A0AAI9ZMA2_9PEZI|nr:uncharacterized protein BDP81DRAFT_50282 [Colletotrichum phormii]KAK1634606.1 hypothetical protein BDP81DRAFT_50282 [Colletotrichum phormii]